MSTLGLSGPPRKTDGLWKGLLWPSIENADDADLAATRGFWICIALALSFVAFTSTGFTLNIGISLESLFSLGVLLFFFLGAVGVREGSTAASASMLLVYFLGTVLYFWASPFHFSFFRLIGLALLVTNMRAAYLIRQWRSDASRQEDFLYGPVRQKQTLRDRFVDQMPRVVWPWGRAAFYALAVAIIPLEVFGMLLLMRK